MGRTRYLLAITLVAAACSGGTSLSDYATEVEALVESMNSRIDIADLEIETATDLVSVKRAVTDRIAARADFVASLKDLDPPEDAVDLQDAAVEIISRLLAAEQVLADQVQAATSLEDTHGIWETPAGIAARVVDAEAVALCEAVQAGFDATEHRETFSDTPWIPTEMREVVRVAFNCTGASP